MLVQLQACEKEQDFASAPIPVSLSVQLWRLPGCHEFLAALGRTQHLDLISYFISVSFAVSPIFCWVKPSDIEKHQPKMLMLQPASLHHSV